MDFEGKEAILQKIQGGGRLLGKLRQYMELSLALARDRDPALAQTIASDMQQILSGGKNKSAPSLPKLTLAQRQPSKVEQARQQAVNATQPQEAKA